METAAYIHVKSDFADPVMQGEPSGQAGPFLTFNRIVNQGVKPALIKIMVNFEVQGVGSNFRFQCSGSAFFEVIAPEKLKIEEVLEMHRKLMLDMEIFLREKIGKNGQLPFIVPMPTLEILQDELHAFIFRYHFGPQAANQQN